MENFSDSYSERSFWDKLTAFLKKASLELLVFALLLYYTAELPETSPWAKSVIYGALGYFILPMDLFPDFLPGGLTDDLAVLAAAISTVAMHITPETKKKATAKVDQWFGTKSPQAA